LKQVSAFQKLDDDDDDDVDISMAWNSNTGNMKASTTKSLGYYNLKLCE
jgi:hypothetical protein